MPDKANSYLDVHPEQDEVTGTCFSCILTPPDSFIKPVKFLLDCGLYQETMYAERNKDFSFEPNEYEFVLVTHGHIDHIGRLPLLYQKGFRGKVYCTRLTAEVIAIALKNTLKIFENELKLYKIPPLYTQEDVDMVLENIVTFKVNKLFYVHKYIAVSFIANAHIFGATSVFLKITYPRQESMTYLFTGDYAKQNRLFEVPDVPKFVTENHLTIFQEATYGSTHLEDIEKVFVDNLKEAIAKNKTIVIPLFAFGRFQEVMYLITQLLQEKVIPRSYRISLDGKLAKEYVELFRKYRSCLKKEVQSIFSTKFRWVDDPDDRELIISDYKKRIILASGGMGSFGPIVEYERRLLDKPDVLFHYMGYTAVDSLGTKILNAKNLEAVCIRGNTIYKQADVKISRESSSHAKVEELIEYLYSIKKLDCITLYHGQKEIVQQYQQTLKNLKISKDVLISNSNVTHRYGPYGYIKSIYHATTPV